MFAKYSSLENHSNSKIINKIRDEGHTVWDKIWVAREKIHGANFSIIITKDSISFAKRSGPIEPTESFFDYENVMARYMPGFKLLQNSLTKLEDSHIQIFGELAGKGIQKEVDYGDKDFYIFDIIGANGVYLNDFVVSFICRNCRLKMAPLIATGSFDDLIKLPNDFQSLVNEYNELWDPDKTSVNKETKFELKTGTDNIAEAMY
ncbi:RNA ligase, phage-associated [Yersinia phage phiR1-RT]|uniref:RNA ligase, phage-associated n=1 Tax=Yersinia phage phiR1-RT TaxID=1206558 RepID=I7LH87_BPPR1|nr:RNA ligase [Yersinia phage phiR1-RT]CCI88754.1 RNA ligase, phage-associated [Yersinia phage phiR1-RT]